MNGNFKIVVVANKHRKALALDCLRDVLCEVNYTPDYELPKDFKPRQDSAGLVNNHLGAYRCFKGHQDALEKCDGAALVLEDDAVPNTDKWLEICDVASKLIKEFEYVSLHTRQIDLTNFNDFDFDGINYLVPKHKSVWAVATLAYIVSDEARKKIISWRYEGWPLDVLVYRNLNYCVVHPSPFDHITSQGSLIDV
jgi:GR25 family glycosyltransferase involved in LPS biosynthesis